METHAHIKKWLNRTGRSKRWLAAQLGVHPDTITRWDEAGGISKKSAMAVQVATENGVTLEMWGLE